MGNHAMFVALVPCYNCGSLVVAVIEATRRHVSRVVAVDDGSTDDTAIQLERCGVDIVRHAENQGKGAALITGWKHILHGGAAALECIITIDADGQHDPDSIPDFIAAYRETKAAIVIGHRLDSPEAIPPLRRYANQLSTRLISWVAGQLLSDVQCGFRLYDAEALRRLLPLLRAGRYELETDILLHAVRAGMRIAFVPIETIYNKESGRRSEWRALRDSFRIGKVILRHLAQRSAT